jgi:hypothetical protein
MFKLWSRVAAHPNYISLLKVIIAFYSEHELLR